MKKSFIPISLSIAFAFSACELIETLPLDELSKEAKEKTKPAEGRPPSPPPQGSCVGDGLVACWLFDDNRGTEAADGSGFGNHARLKGVGWSPGQHGSALQFDGRGVAIADSSPSFNQTGITGSFEIVTLVRLDAQGQTANFVSRKETGTENHHFALGVVNGRAVAKVHFYYVEADSPLPIQRWTKLATTYDGVTLRLLIDDAEVAQTAIGWPIAADSSPVVLGSHTLHGQIDETRIYAQLQAGKEPSPPPQMGKSPDCKDEAIVGCWQFDDESRPGLDLSGMSNHFSAKDLSMAPGVYGTSLVFDGKSRATAEASQTINATGNRGRFSITGWVRLSDRGQTGTIMARQELGTPHQHFRLGFSEGQLFGQVHFFTVQSGLAVARETWTHVSTTYDGVSMKLYVNGEMAGEMAIGWPIAADSTPLVLGNSSLNDGLRGALDDVRLYSRALDPAEVAALAKHKR